MTLINQKDSATFSHLPIEQYDTLLTEKVTHLKSLLMPFANIDTDVNTDVNVSEHQVIKDMAIFSSPTSHFRMRAEFGIWHEGEDCNYIMMEKDEDGNKLRIKINDFPIAGQAINKLMPILLDTIKSHPLLKQRLFQIEFLSTLSEDMLVTLIYHKRLEDDWQELAQQLQTDLGCHIIGRSRKQKLVLSQDFAVEKLEVLNQTYTYKQLEGGFTQPNANVCQSMLTWACEQAKFINTNNHSDNSSKKSDLLELYCGNANFTLPLSQYFDKVLATEISKTSVYSAQWNIEENKQIKGVANIAIARLSAEEFTQAKTGEREFRRLKQVGIELADYQFSTVFVDPPRAGIDDNTLKLLSEFDNIIYISCNPNTLVDNLQTLCKTHILVSSALFDQFPYTHHTEAGVMLCKKP